MQYSSTPKLTYLMRIAMQDLKLHSIFVVVPICEKRIKLIVNIVAISLAELVYMLRCQAIVQ